MKIKQFEVWIADLNPRMGTETEKVRPVVIIQTDLLNVKHPSTVICPITTNLKAESKILRVRLNKGDAGVKEDCEIMLDQIRAIDNGRLLHRIGFIESNKLHNAIKENIKIVLDLGERFG